MTDNPYDTILDSIVSDVKSRGDPHDVTAVESAVQDYLDDYFPQDESERFAAAVGIVMEADAEPSENWTKRVDDVENSSPEEAIDALAADVIVSDTLGAA